MAHLTASQFMIVNENTGDKNSKGTLDIQGHKMNRNSAESLESTASLEYINLYSGLKEAINSPRTLPGDLLIEKRIRDQISFKDYAVTDH